jgi:hypothetical protein
MTEGVTFRRHVFPGRHARIHRFVRFRNTGRHGLVGRFSDCFQAQGRMPAIQVLRRF